MPSYAVTGAARGIGFEFVRQLSSSADNVVFALVRSKKTAQKLEGLKRPNVFIFEADISNHEALKDAAQQVSKITGGKLDVLINNAAVVNEARSAFTLDGYPDSHEEDLLEKDLKEAFNVNVIGVIHTINAFLPLLRAGNTKKVLTLSTGAADPEFNEKAEMPFMAAYSISKAALNMAVTKYAIQYKAEGLVFLAISPGAVNTAEGDTAAEKEEIFTALTAMFQKVKPSFQGPITPEVSVKAQLAVLEKLTVKDTGAFISHHGNKDWL